MSEIVLRPYQRECLAAIKAQKRGAHLIHLPTGAGKTVIFSHIPRRGRVLLISHRDELVRQPVKYYDCPVGIEQAGEHEHGEEVVSASVQSLARRVDRFDPETFDSIIVDECHHSSADSYRKILDYFDNRLTLGFTATPNRADGKGLGDIFEDIIFSRDLRWMIQQGYLSDIKCLRVNIGYDLSRVHIRGGDYAPGELEEAMDGTETAIAQAYREHAKGATLIFAASVAHANRIAEQIPGAAVITGKTPNRAEILQAFTRREIPVLVNCMVLTEGTDLPLVETVIIARPTRSQPLYCQMVGRGLRLSPGKEYLTLIDCTGVTKNNDICTAPSLIGLDISDVAPERKKNIQGRLFDLEQIAQAEKDVPETWIRSIELVDLWAKNVGYHTHGVNWTRNPDGSMVVTLADYNEVFIPAPDSLGYTSMPGIGRMSMQSALDEAYRILCRDFDYCRPLWDTNVIKRWGGDAATEKQINIIKRSKLTRGWQIPEELTKGQAAQVINHIFARKRGGR